MTWLCRAPDGLIRMGFMAASGSTPAVAAWAACERPISRPSRVTTEFKAMFCALIGEARTPYRCSLGHTPAALTDLLAAHGVLPTTDARLPRAPTESRVTAARRPAL